MSSHPPCQISLLRTEKYESGGRGLGNKLESPLLKMFCPESPPCLFSAREPHVLTYWVLTFLTTQLLFPRFSWKASCASIQPGDAHIFDLLEVQEETSGLKFYLTSGFIFIFYNQPIYCVMYQLYVSNRHIHSLFARV